MCVSVSTGTSVQILVSIFIISGHAPIQKKSSKAGNLWNLLYKFFVFFLCVKDEAEWVIIFSLQCFLKSSLSHIYMLTSELLIVCLPVQYPSHSVCLCSPLSIILPLYWAHKYTTQWFIFLIFHMLWLSPMSALQSVAGKLSLLTPPASYCSFMSLMLTASQ